MLSTFYSEYSQNQSEWRNQQVNAEKVKTNFIHFYSNYNPHKDLEKSIDKQNAEKIQCQIMSMTGGLSTNVAQPQGYIARSKCRGITTAPCSDSQIPVSRCGFGEVSTGCIPKN
jgi:response regulator of citrate/malate metabolism